MKRRMVLILFSLFMTGADAQTRTCEPYGELVTKKGKLIESLCKTKLLNGNDIAESVWSLENLRLLTGRYPISLEAKNKEKTIFVLRDAPNIRTGCPDQLYIVDLTPDVPHILAFGVSNACNEFQSAKWSDKRPSVITLKDDIHFLYANGKVTIPNIDNGDQFGTATVSAAHNKNIAPKPFIKDVMLPK